MTIKEAILISLENFTNPANFKEICNYILSNHPKLFSGKTPENTIHAILGNFFRNGDTRIKRIKNSKGNFYYLAKHENKLGIDLEKYLESLQEINILRIPKQI